MTDSVRGDVAHLLRRAAFAPTVAELDRAESAGYSATLAALFAAAPDAGAAATPMPTFPTVDTEKAAAGSPARKAARVQAAVQVKSLTAWWLDRMTAADNVALERRTWFWHGHFATSVAKVHSATFMGTQNQTFRTLGLGPFDALTLAVDQGAAMMKWLDAQTNVAANPNENLARETMELFALGLGNYSEGDVREGAYCLTGWSFDRTTGAFVNRAKEHDNGIKTVLGSTGNFDGTDFINLITRRPQAARWVTTRIWDRHVAPVTPGASDPTAIADASQRTAAGAVVMDDVWHRILTSAPFLAPAVRGALVAQPVEYVIGAMRQLGLRASEHARLVHATLAQLGQVPFEPPNVGGWPEGRAWLSTSAALGRATFARELSAAADLSAVSDTPTSGRVEAVLHLLALDTVPMSATTLGALSAVAGEPAQLMALALCSPEYVTR